MRFQTARLIRAVQRHLPVFEATARHGSFTLAGDELGRTQSAVSRQIKDLESKLGRKLFRRKHKRIDLNETGEKLFRAYTFAARHLADAIEDILQEKSEQQVVLSTSTSNAAFFLMPHVSDVRDCFPGGEIFVVTSEPQGISQSENVDFSLVFGKPDLVGMKSVPLFNDIISPVCSPAYLEENGPVAELEDILSLNLLYMQAQHSSCIGWRRWLRNFGLEPPSGSRQLAFSNYYHVIQACMGGHGFALGWLRLLGDQLKNGQLVAPLSEQVETDDQYYLAYPSHKSSQWNLAPFHDWLITEFG